MTTPLSLCTSPPRRIARLSSAPNSTPYTTLPTTVRLFPYRLIPATLSSPLQGGAPGVPGGPHLRPQQRHRPPTQRFLQGEGGPLQQRVGGWRQQAGPHRGPGQQHLRSGRVRMWTGAFAWRWSPARCGPDALPRWCRADDCGGSSCVQPLRYCGTAVVPDVERRVLWG